MDTKNQTTPGDVNQPFEVGLFRPEDAQGIVNLFRSVHGESYPIKLFYDPKALTKANDVGDYYSVVARTPDGRVIGVHHLYRSAPNKSLYEWGVGLVSRESRGRGVSLAIGRHMADVLIPKLGMDAAFGESVCYHTHMQKMSGSHGFVEMALEIALMPGEAYAAEEHALGRVATLLQFRSYKPKPHKVFLPSCYDRELRLMYSALDDNRDLQTADVDLPADRESELQMSTFDFAQVARIAARETGSDFEACLADLESQTQLRNMDVIQVWLNLAHPWVAAAVDILRRRGYFLGGVLPRWFEEDGLLMQKVYCDPCFQEIQLYSERSEQILEIVKQDYGSTQASS